MSDDDSPVHVGDRITIDGVLQPNAPTVPPLSTLLPTDFWTLSQEWNNAHQGQTAPAGRSQFMFFNTGSLVSGRPARIFDNGLQMRRYGNNTLGWGPGVVLSENAFNARGSNPTSSNDRLDRIVNMMRAMRGEPPLPGPSINVPQMQEDDDDVVSLASTTDSETSGMMTPSTDSEIPPIEANDMEPMDLEMSGMMTPSTATESGSGAMTPTTVDGDMELEQAALPMQLNSSLGTVVYSGRRKGFGASDTRGTVSFVDPSGVWRTVPVRDDGWVESRNGVTITHSPGRRTYLEEMGVLPRSQDPDAAQE
ncbi:hypothetical protein JCM24511_03125 [Saitozyma sp. JCM 24511]|nr:hypothetical protein JCM24511_03125 [Saitozyma sp. JCM 24511]